MKNLIGLLEQINIYPHKALRSNYYGNYMRNTKGHSNDFLKYENYKIGDDLNKVDWKKYCKSRELLSKQFGEEKNYRVVISVDTSKSMEYGDPLKSVYQKDIVESIGYSVLYHQHPLVLIDMVTFDYIEIFPPVEKGMNMVSEWISKRKYNESFKFSNDVIYSLFGDSLNICISDGWFEGYEKFVGYQFSVRNDLILLHIVSQQEIIPPLNGTFILTDSETGEKISIDFTDHKINEYSKLIKEIFDEKKNCCKRYGYRYFRCISGSPINDLLISMGR